MTNHVRAPSHARTLAWGGLLALGLSLPATWVFVACTDTPPPSAPGNVVIDDSMQDAELQVNEDASIQYGPQGLDEAGIDGAYIDSSYGSSGYEDVGSPLAACTSCKCDMRVGYCLENGSSTTSTAAPVSGFCGLAGGSNPEVGCNALPAACASNPTCECVLDAVQPPLPCYPECTTASGYIDVFCQTP